MRRDSDPHYQREMEQVVEKGMRAGIWVVWFQLVVSTAILGSVILLCSQFRAPAALMISATVAASTLCLIAIFNHGMIVINGSLAAMGSALEWMDRPRAEEPEVEESTPIEAELLVRPVRMGRGFGTLVRRH